MKLERLAAIAVIVLLLQVPGPPPAAAANTFSEGLKQFQATRYHAAAELFTQAERQSPNNQQVHLYMGKTLEKLKDASGAQSEYQACFNINPFTDLGQQAKTALLNISASQAARANAPLDDPKTVRQTIGIIQRQTREAKARHMNWANVYAQQRLARIGMTNFNQGWTRAQLRWLRRTDPYFADEISSQQIIRNHYYYTDGQTQALRALHWGTRAANDLQQSANNLISQIDKPGVLADDATLRAQGTNLYVRYYGKPEQDDTVPQDPLEELKATAKKLPAAGGAHR